MPNLRAHLQRHPPPASDLDTDPEKIHIYLPSELPSGVRADLCMKGLCEVEDRLRNAQAFEALSDLRRQLRTRTLTAKFKSRNISGQGAWTRLRTLQDGIEVRIKAARVRYCAARTALLSLRGPGDWEKVLQELKQQDVRGINERVMNEQEKEDYRRTHLRAGLSAEGSVKDVEEELEEELEHATVPTIFSVGEGCRTLSWIWYTVSEDEMNQDWSSSLNDGSYFLFSKIIMSN